MTTMQVHISFEKWSLRFDLQNVSILFVLFITDEVKTVFLDLSWGAVYRLICPQNYQITVSRCIKASIWICSPQLQYNEMFKHGEKCFFDGLFSFLEKYAVKFTWECKLIFQIEPKPFGFE